MCRTIENAVVLMTLDHYLPDNIILKLICLFILLFCFQNTKMVTIYWFYRVFESQIQRYAGCGLTRQYKDNQSCGNTISDL